MISAARLEQSGRVVVMVGKSPSRTTLRPQRRTTARAILKATHGSTSAGECVRSPDASHVLSLIPYKKVTREKVKLPKRTNNGAYDDHF